MIFIIINFPLVENKCETYSMNQISSLTLEEKIIFRRTSLTIDLLSSLERNDLLLPF